MRSKLVFWVTDLMGRRVARLRALAGEHCGQPGKRCAVLLVGIVSLLAYASSLSIPFLWDDVAWIVEDPAVRSVANIPSFFTNVSTRPPDIEGRSLRELRFYRPLVGTVYAIEYSLFGPNPRGYHAVNVLLNALVVVLFLLVVREISGDSRLALVAALLYAVNPIRGEAVYWVYGLSEILMALWVLAALLLYHRGRIVGAAVCFVPALFAREPAILFPGILLLYEYFVSPRKDARRFLRVLGFVVLAAVFLLWRNHVVGETPGLTNVAPVTFANTAAVIVQKNLKILLLPDGPVVHYPLRLYPDATPVVIFSWLVVIAVCVGFIAMTRRNRQLAFWFAWFFAWLLLSLNIGRLGEYLFAEKWLYLPAGGMCVVAAALLLERRAGPVLLAAVMVVHFGTVVVRSTYWQSSLSYFEQLVASAPEFELAHYMLGKTYAERRDFAKAAAEFETAVRLQPRNSWALNNLGNCYWVLGDRGRAGRAWESAFAVDPLNVYAAYNVGMAADAAGDYGKALQYYRRFVQGAKEPRPELLARIAQLERRVAVPVR